MTQPTQYNTYDLTVGVIVDIEDMIHMLDAVDVPLLGMQGADGRSALSTGTCFEKQVDWLDEEILLPKSTLAAQINNTTASTVVTVASGHRLRFSTGDVLIVNDEKLRVESYGTTTDTLIVTRAFAGTSVDTQATSETVLVLGQALAEGSNPEDPRARDRSNRTNVTQIFGPTAVRVSGTENVVRKYGLSGTSEFDHQVANRTKEMFIQLEQAILYGSKYESTTTEVRTMGGFSEFITTNTDSTTTTLTETALLDQIQNSWDVGGRVDRATLGATQKRKVSAFTTDITVNVAQADATRGTVVEYFDCDFGRVSMLLNRWVRSSDLFLYDRDQAQLLTLRPAQFEMLAKTGDSIHGQIVGEKTLRFRRERHAARFSALT